MKVGTGLRYLLSLNLGTMLLAQVKYVAKLFKLIAHLPGYLIPSMDHRTRIACKADCTQERHLFIRIK